jgi:hypothetical protein
MWVDESLYLRNWRNSLFCIYTTVLQWVGLHYRVDRVLDFFSSRPNWDSPTLSRAGESAIPPLFGSGGGLHSLEMGEGVGGPNSDEGTYTVVLYR